MTQNMFGSNSELSLTVVRYGNVVASRGSVVPFFLEQFKKKKFVTVTEKSMTRFSIFLEQGVEAVLWSIKNSKGGEIIIPKAPSMKIMDLAEVIADKKIKIIGKRPGEKLHEELISQSESYHTIDLGKYYAILPENNFDNSYKYYNKTLQIKKFPPGLPYNSKDNKKYFNKKDIKDLIQKIS